MFQRFFIIQVTCHVRSRSMKKKAVTPIPIRICDKILLENNFSIAPRLQNHLFSVFVISSQIVKKHFGRFSNSFLIQRWTELVQRKPALNNSETALMRDQNQKSKILAKNRDYPRYWQENQEAKRWKPILGLKVWKRMTFRVQNVGL